jgi:A/G-specific adenine glycosylase
MARRTGTRHRAATSAPRLQGKGRFLLSDIVDLRLKRRFQRRLLGWYAEHGRDLPWRKTKDPYRILVSEVMLQQTQVDRVVPKYHEFLDRYPSFQELAAAEPREVREHWHPLGYNVRPYRLHSIACEAVSRYGGTLPNDPDQLLAMKGIGRYTAGAIRSFAFDEDAAILDTNVMRVLHRVFLGAGDAKDKKSVLWTLSEALIPKGKAYDFNQALMDFGAMQCTARDPYCLLCPMKEFCKSYPFTGSAKK